MLIRTGKARSELIRCPECEEPQFGTILEAVPFPIYVHTCRKCKYVITESDWNPVLTDRDVLTDGDIVRELLKRGLWVNPYYVPDKTVCEKTEWFMAGIADSDIMAEAIKRGFIVISRV